MDRPAPVRPAGAGTDYRIASMALSLSPAVKRQYQYWLVAVSLGHLLFVRRWWDLEHLQAKALDYYREAPASGTLAAATLLGSLLLALLFRASWMWVERNPNRFRVTLGHCVFLAVLIFPLETMRNFWNAESGRIDWFTNLSILTLDGVLIGGGLAPGLGWGENLGRAAAPGVFGAVSLPGAVPG